MSKYKVKRYDGEEGIEVSAEDEAAMDAAGRFVESGSTEPGMPRRPISRTPVAAPSRVSGPGRKPSGPSRADYSNEGKGDSKYRKQTMTPESQALERVYPEQYLGMPGIKGIAAVAKSLANRGATTGAKEVAKRIEPTMEAAKAAKSVNVRPSAADPKILEKVSAALKNAPRAVSKPTASQAAFAKGPKGPLGRQSAAERDAILRGDTMDEFGGAMRRGGAVKKMASGGSTGSFRSSANGIAQRGKTRGKMC